MRVESLVQSSHNGMNVHNEHKGAFAHYRLWYHSPSLRKSHGDKLAYLLPKLIYAAITAPIS